MNHREPGSGSLAFRYSQESAATQAPPSVNVPLRLSVGTCGGDGGRHAGLLPATGRQYHLEIHIATLIHNVAHQRTERSHVAEAVDFSQAADLGAGGIRSGCACTNPLPMRLCRPLSQDTRSPELDRHMTPCSDPIVKFVRTVRVSRASQSQGWPPVRLPTDGSPKAMWTCSGLKSSAQSIGT